ncbi:unnamed protein product, partial [Tilletia caries]
MNHQKEQHWEEFLSSLDEHTVWTAARYKLNGQSFDKFIPPIKADGNTLTDPESQADAFHQAFTQASADADLSDIPDTQYPQPHPNLQIREEHLAAALDRMQSGKAAD